MFCCSFSIKGREYISPGESFRTSGVGEALIEPLYSLLKHHFVSGEQSIGDMDRIKFASNETS